MPKWMTVAFALFLSLQVFSTQGRDVEAILREVVKTPSAAPGFNHPLLNAEVKGSQATLVAVIEWQGRKYYKIALLLRTGATSYYLVDVDNGQILPFNERQTGKHSQEPALFRKQWRSEVWLYICLFSGR